MMAKRPGKVVAFGDIAFTLGDMEASALIRARALRGFDTLLARHGGDAAALLRAAGLAAMPGDPEATLPLATVADLMAQAARQLDLPGFGLQLAQHQDISVLGTLALIVRHSATLGAALSAIARYLPYHTPGARMQLETDSHAAGRVLITYDLHLAPGEARRHATELSFCVLQNFLLLATGGDCSGWEFQFRHPQPDPSPAYAEFFHCPVRFGQPRDRMALPASLLAVPIDQDNAMLRDTAERFVGNVIRRHPLDLAQQVEALAARQLTAGGNHLRRIASQLGLHPRTLQRRLKEQDLHFEDVLDALRRRQAREYLGYAALPLTEVAALLGYTEQSSFNRACRRWFGATPQVLRDQLGEAAAV